MWLFTSNAFVSVVTDKEDPQRRLVRARSAGDIEELFPEAQIFEDSQADYRYRAFLPADDVSQWLDQYVHNMEYPNFKSSISTQKSLYQQVCHSVWSILKGLQTSDDRP